MSQPGKCHEKSPKNPQNIGRVLSLTVSTTGVEVANIIA